MKKKFLFAVISSILVSNILLSQSFSNGSLILSLNTGLEVYNTEYKYQIKNTNFDTIIKDQAGNANYYLGLEYGLLKWLGLG